MAAKPRIVRPEWPEDATDAIILSVRLRSGAFESSIEVPLDGTRDEFNELVGSWLELMASGIRIGKRGREAK